LLGAHRTKSPPAKQMERIAAGATPDRNNKRHKPLYMRTTTSAALRAAIKAKVNTLSL
jgi:hypothetical protein